MCLFTILIISIFSGVVGGIINWTITSTQNQAKISIWKLITLGVGAALLVPLFLEFVSSEILNELTTCDCSKPSSESIKNYLLFTGYCLIAGISSQAFINKLSQSVLSQNLQHLTEENKKLVKYTGKQKNENQEKLSNYSVKTLLENNIISTAIGPIINPEDIHKGRFGGKSARNNRILEVEVIADPINLNWFKLKLNVKSTNQSKYPLTSNVIFYLHDTFAQPVITVQPDEAGVAMLEIKSWGAFTVGVVTDDGNTLLEKDLAADSDYPKLFRER